MLGGSKMDRMSLTSHGRQTRHEVAIHLHT